MNKIYNNYSKFQEKVMSPNKIEKRLKAVKVTDAINNIEGGVSIRGSQRIINLMDK